jgi:hypothetical protein
MMAPKQKMMKEITFILVCSERLKLTARLLPSHSSNIAMLIFTLKENRLSKH